MSGWESYEIDQATTDTLSTYMRGKDPDIEPFRYLVAVDGNGDQTIWVPPNVKAWAYQEENSTMPEAKVVLMDAIHSGVYKLTKGGTFAAWCGGNPRRWWLSSMDADVSLLQGYFSPVPPVGINA